MPVTRREDLRVRTVDLIGCFLLAATVLAGCADLKAIFSPSQPPATPPAPAAKPSPAPPVRKAPAPPPPVLSPEVGRADEERLKREANGRIQKAEELIQQVDQQKLAKEQRETFSTVQSFLAKAKEALSAQDFLRAFNLADKAQVLAEELFRSLQ